MRAIKNILPVAFFIMGCSAAPDAPDIAESTTSSLEGDYLEVHGSSDNFCNLTAEPTTPHTVPPGQYLYAKFTNDANSEYPLEVYRYDSPVTGRILLAELQPGETFPKNPVSSKWCGVHGAPDFFFYLMNVCGRREEIRIHCNG